MKGVNVENNSNCKYIWESFSDENTTNEYMKKENIEISVEVYTGTKDFTAYTMDLTKKYIDINADYRS